MHYIQPLVQASAYTLSLPVAFCAPQAVSDDFANPYDVVMRNARHESKVKEWKHMAPEQK